MKRSDLIGRNIKIFEYMLSGKSPEEVGAMFCLSGTYCRKLAADIARDMKRDADTAPLVGRQKTVLTTMRKNKDEWLGAINQVRGQRELALENP